MPKSANEDSQATAEGGVVFSALNGINESLLKGYVESIEGEQTEIDAIMKAATEACQPHVDEIKAIKKAAAENGIAKKPLSAKLRERSLSRKAEGCRETLSEEQQSIFDEISSKLGDLPLFRGLDS